jgi:hypothetical protein
MLCTMGVRDRTQAAVWAVQRSLIEGHIMGFAVTGRCGCGYAAEFLEVGVGMRDTPNVWLGPCICRKCRQVVSANVLAKAPKCPECKAKGVEPYGDPNAGKEEGEQYPSCAASEPLFDTTFECPACGKKSLTFAFAGMWD